MRFSEKSKWQDNRIYLVYDYELVEVQWVQKVQKEYDKSGWVWYHRSIRIILSGYLMPQRLHKVLREAR